MKEVQKLPRHLEMMHEEEPQVKQIMSMPPGSNARLKLIAKLRDEGAFIKNRTVWRKNEGVIVPKRRVEYAKMNEVFKIGQYLPCEFCFATYKSSYMYRHKANCPRRPGVEDKSHQHQRYDHARGKSALLLPVSQKVEERFAEHIIAPLRMDDYYFVIRNDEYILKLGQRIYEGVGSGAECGNYVRQKMKELARILIKFRKIRKNDTATLLSCFKPQNVRDLIEAVKLEAGYDPNTQTFKIPSLVTKVATSVRKVIVQAKGFAIEEGNERLKKSLEDFLLVFNSRFENVSRGALRTLRKKKFNKPMRIPLTEDIKSLNIYLQDEIERILSIPLPDFKDLCILVKVTLCLIIAFNRKRAGEAEKIKLENICNIQTGDLNSDVTKHLNDFETQLASSLSRFEIMGKRGRRVPVLLTPLMKSAVKVIADKVNRNILEINPNNVYLFAIPGTENSRRRGCDVMREYSQKCGAKEPKLLRSTVLRKEMAVMSQLLNLSEDEQDTLSTFLGHDITVHRDYYRLPESTLQLARIGKLITSKERGIILEGTIEDIDVEDSLEADDPNEDDIEDNIESSDEEEDDNLDQNSNACAQGKKRAKSVTVQPPKKVKSVPVELQEKDSAQGKKRAKSVTVQPQKEVKSVPNKVVRRPWDEKALGCLKSHFKNFLHVDFLPSKNQFEECLEKYPAILKDRKWTNLKDRLRHYQKFQK